VSPNERVTKIHTWTAEQVQTFLSEVADDPLYPAWRMAFATGMRRGEILGLPWSGVDLKRSRLSVTRSLVTVNGRTEFSPPKTSKGRRVVALDRETVAVLRSHRATQAQQKLLLGPMHEDHDLVICQPIGRPIDPDGFSKKFRRQVKNLGLPPIRLHDARHTHATMALQAGVHVKVVSERLGHSSIALTLDTYSHAIPAMQEEAAEQIAALFAIDR
jgi:integrase